MKKIFTTFVFIVMLTSITIAQPWIQDNGIFNPSGIPSLPFSQPRLADLDGDGDFDLVIGSFDDALAYFENTGSSSEPSFAAGDDIFSMASPLDAEMAVFTDMDADGDPDMITGGFTGLHLFLNTGTAQNPVFEQSEGFFSGIEAGQNPVPDFADLDDDGDQDMVLGFSESGLVKIYTNTGTATAGQFEESVSYEVGDVGLYAYPVFCDPDHDGDFDLVAGRDTYGFVMYENTGTQVSAAWEINDSYLAGLGDDTYWNSPTLADLNGDDEADLVFGTASGPLQYFEQAGSMAAPDWSENTSLFGGVLDAGGASNPSFYDFDGDGDLDMISGSQFGDIKYFENTGTASGPAWNEDNSYFSAIDLSIYSDITIGDLDADGLPDAICGDLSGNLYYYRNTGEGFVMETGFLQGVSLGGWSSPYLYDMDDDDDLDIVAGAEDGTLHYFENQGTQQVADWVEITDYFGSIDVGGNCVPAIADVDFDGAPDVICGTISGGLKCYLNTNGSWVEDFTLFDGIEVNQNATPGFGDLDNDGDSDLALGQYSGSFSYYRNQHFVTGILIPESANRINITTRPNPVINDLTIDCRVQETSQVKIRISGMDGKTYASRDAYFQASETNSITFSTREWPSGIYIVNLSTQSETTIGKIIKN